jgi:hypothetical protein
MRGSGRVEWRHGREKTLEVSGFLELSRMGRTMAIGTDEVGSRAAKMDEWMIWEAEERVVPRY